MSKITHILCDFNGVLLISNNSHPSARNINTPLLQYLETLQLPISIISASSQATLDTYFSLLHPPCQEVISSRDRGWSKASPDDLKTFCQEKGLLPAQTLLIDDNRLHIQAAHTAGMQAIYFTSTANCIHDLQSYALA